MLTLTRLDPDLTAALAAGDRETLVGAPNLASVVSLVEDVARAHLALYRRTGASAPWLGYLARDPRSARIVGACAFKDVPRGGIVEIAYYTFPDSEGRGVGRAMAAELIAIARADAGVVTVLAHTAPEENFSTRILRGHGFAFTGEVEDPEDGRVFRWQLPMR